MYAIIIQITKVFTLFRKFSPFTTALKVVFTSSSMLQIEKGVYLREIGTTRFGFITPPSSSTSSPAHRLTDRDQHFLEIHVEGVFVPASVPMQALATYVEADGE